MALTIQRFPRAGGDPVTKTLAEWGLAPGSMESAAWIVGQLTLVARGASPAFSDPVFDYLDTLKVFDGTTCLWWGPVISTGSTVQPAEQRTYTVADPLWRAQYVPFGWPYSPEPEELDPEFGGLWLGLALAQVAAVAPITYEAADMTAFVAPCPDLRGSANCLEIIQRVARLHPGSAQWWDLSGSVPELRCALRSGLASVNLSRSRCLEPITLTPLHDQQLTGVRCEYSYTNSSGTRSSVLDDGGPGPYAGANALVYGVKVGDDSALSGAANYDAATAAADYHVAALIYAARSALPWAGTLTVVGTPDTPLPTIRPGQLLNLTGGRTEWASMNAQVQRVARTLGETCERLTIELGLGEQLGPQDFGALARAGGVSGGAGGGNPSPWDNPTPPPPSDDGTTPGTYHELNNEGTGGGSPNGSIAVEARGGNWGLGGEPEFTQSQELCSDGVTVWVPAVAASTPPRRYRRLEIAGSFVDPDPAACFGAWVTASGARQYNAATLAVTDTTTASGNNRGPITGLSAAAMPFAGSASAMVINTGYPCNRAAYNRVESTTRRVAGVAGTYDLADCNHRPVGGQLVATLTDEDTDEAAITRLLATEPEWSAGTTGIRTVRASGITGVYRELRYRTQHTETAGEQIWREGYYDAEGNRVPGHYETITVTTINPTLTGLWVWQRYRVTIQLERRPVNEAGTATGDWEHYAERVHSILPGIDGEAGFDWQVEEPPAGFEIRVGDSTVEVEP